VFGGDRVVDRVAMKTNFRIVGLPLTQFEPLFSLDDHELAQKVARRLIVDAKPGFPCRVSLQDAEIGERVILARFVHHDVESRHIAHPGRFLSAKPPRKSSWPQAKFRT